MVLLAAVPAAAGTEPAFITIRGTESSGPPVTWDALVRYLTRALAGQDHQAA